MANINTENKAMQVVSNSKETIHPGKLTVTALSNPSPNYFTIRTYSGSGDQLQLRVIDILGRSVETRKSVMANTTFHIGQYFRPGVYSVEVIQGTQRQMLKLIKR